MPSGRASSAIRKSSCANTNQFLAESFINHFAAGKNFVLEKEALSRELFKFFWSIDQDIHSYTRLKQNENFLGTIEKRQVAFFNNDEINIRPGRHLPAR